MKSTANMPTIAPCSNASTMAGISSTPDCRSRHHRAGTKLTPIFQALNLPLIGEFSDTILWSRIGEYLNSPNSRPLPSHRGRAPVGKTGSRTSVADEAELRQREELAQWQRERAEYLASRKRRQRAHRNGVPARQSKSKLSASARK